MVLTCKTIFVYLLVEKQKAKEKKYSITSIDIGNCKIFLQTHTIFDIR